MYEYEDYIEHHGILGQKWGVRRFQRADGTRTPAGKRRERGEYNEEQSTSSGNVQNGGAKRSIDGKKVRDFYGRQIAIGVTVGLGAALLANPGARNVLTKYGKTAGKAVKDSAQRAGKAMLDAALISAGSIAISKVAKKLEPKEGATEFERNRNKIASDAVAGGIRSLTGANKNGKGGGNSGNNNGGNGGVKSTKEYQELFNGLDNANDRQRIKDAANNGASIEDLQELRSTLGHAEFEDWASQYMAIEIGW